MGIFATGTAGVWMFRPELRENIRPISMFHGAIERALDAKATRLVEVMPTLFSQASRAPCDQIGVDTLITTVSPMDGAGNFSFGTTIDYALPTARRVILEVPAVSYEGRLATSYLPVREALIGMFPCDRRGTCRCQEIGSRIVRSGAIWIEGKTAPVSLSPPRRRVSDRAAFMAPTVNERERTIAFEGRGGDAQLADAKAAIDRGEGTKHMIGYLTAQTFWDVNNPDTRGTHTDHIRKYSVPTISIVGRNDPLFKDTDFLDRFTAEQKVGMATTLWLDNGPLACGEVWTR